MNTTQLAIESQCCRLILTRPTCPLRFNDRLVYSLLLSQVEHIPLHHNTVRDRKAYLVLVGLLDLEHKPTDPLTRKDWFTQRKGGKKGSAGWSYLNLYLPSENSPLSLKACAVYSYLYSVASDCSGHLVSPPTSLSHLAGCLSLSEETVSKELDLLALQGMVTVCKARKGGRLLNYFKVVLGLPDHCLPFFAPKEQVEFEGLNLLLQKTEGEPVLDNKQPLPVQQEPIQPLPAKQEPSMDTADLDYFTPSIRYLLVERNIPLPFVRELKELHQRIVKLLVGQVAMAHERIIADSRFTDWLRVAHDMNHYETYPHCGGLLRKRLQQQIDQLEGGVKLRQQAQATGKAEREAIYVKWTATYGNPDTMPLDDTALDLWGIRQPEILCNLTRLIPLLGEDNIRKHIRDHGTFSVQRGIDEVRQGEPLDIACAGGRAEMLALLPRANNNNNNKPTVITREPVFDKFDCAAFNRQMREQEGGF